MLQKGSGFVAIYREQAQYFIQYVESFNVLDLGHNMEHHGYFPGCSKSKLNLDLGLGLYWIYKFWCVTSDGILRT